MTPDALFQLSGPLAMIGWGALILPLLLSVAYTALVLSFWSGTPGGFGSLAEVMALFTTPGVALAGWLHYLAFDLFVGAWIARTARSEGVPHAFVIPCLLLTFLFGPAGFLAFHILRASRALAKVPT